MNFGYIYLMVAALGLGLAYFPVSFILARLFASNKTHSWKKLMFSFVIIMVSSLLISAISLTVPHGLDNRFLHAFGGGFMAVLVCFISFKNHDFKMSRFQFAIMAILLGMAFGTANEMFEFFLQSNFGLVANASLNDTWLDLASNTVGMFIALPLLLPFVRTRILTID